MNHYNTIRQAIGKAYPSCGFHTSETLKIYERTNKEKDDKMRSTAVEHELKFLRELATLHKTETMMYFIKAVQSHPAKPKTECPDTAASSDSQSSQSSKIKNSEEERVESNRQALVKKGNPVRT